MNTDFHHREQENRFHHDRHNTIANKHETMETWQLEQDEAGQRIVQPINGDMPPKPGLWARVKKLVGRK